MPNVLDAADYLASPEKHPPRPVCVLFGDEGFLKRQVLVRLRRAVLGEGAGDVSFSTFDGPGTRWRDVLDELGTLAMFGGQRLVLVEQADKFVSLYRTELEDYVAAPKPSGVLVLEVGAWPANTRLHKAVAAAGLAIECRAPQGAALGAWLVRWAEQVHKFQLAPLAAETLVELVGPELGLLDQELAKLALTARPGGKITAEAVRESVGAWRAKTTWEMFDAALDGNVREAMTQLHRLLLAGEAPVAILAQISSSLRRFASATRVFLTAEAEGRRPSARDALQQAGVKGFLLDQAERRLRRLGRRRGAQLYQWLLQSDLDLKGASALPARLVLERLILRIALPDATPARGGR